MKSGRNIFHLSLLATLSALLILWLFTGGRNRVEQSNDPLQPSPAPSNGDQRRRSETADAPNAANNETPSSKEPADPARTPRPSYAAPSFSTLPAYEAERLSRAIKPPRKEQTPYTVEEQPVREAYTSIRNFHGQFGENPVGSNAEITAALMGKNPAGSQFLEFSRNHVNSNGELVDAWGRPFFFHANSGDSMEIRSAGPDGKLFTPDDIIVP